MKAKAKAKSGAKTKPAAKKTAAKTTAHKTTVRARKTSRAYHTAGMTSDGVRLLQPKSQPDSFTAHQVRSAVRGVLGDA
jgi:hypothetical protein